MKRNPATNVRRLAAIYLIPLACTAGLLAGIWSPNDFSPHAHARNQGYSLTKFSSHVRFVASVVRYVLEPEPSAASISMMVSNRVTTPLPLQVSNSNYLAISSTNKPSPI